MIISRKKFLRVTGVSILATAGGRLAGICAGAMQNTFSPSPQALTAKRWAMVVDLKKCAQEEDGCTQCIDACNQTHNVPQSTEPAHNIKWIWKDSFEKAFPSGENEYQSASVRNTPVLLLCNHCDNPPCVRVCPTKATWKREEDGIVMMDWHRCIGCRYCMAACPYGSRSFNWSDPRLYIAEENPDFPTRTIGVVEKCTFCDERLAKGELPACVEACPQNALLFGDLNDENSQVRQMLQSVYTIRRKPELGTAPEVFYIV
jgi:Fe-S-cluster-containing dehydrogenase component